MQKKGANISLKGYDDIFSTDQSRAEAQQERVQEIPLSELHPFEGHPFRVVDDEEMMKTAESVRDFGVLTPAIVRPDPDGGYEIVSGHRRHRASELAGKETMPAIVRDLDDDAAIILMVDANLQRESIAKNSLKNTVRKSQFIKRRSKPLMNCRLQSSRPCNHCMRSFISWQSRKSRTTLSTVRSEKRKKNC